MLKILKIKNQNGMINRLDMIFLLCGSFVFLIKVPWHRGGRKLKLQPFSPHVPLILLQASPSAHFPHSELQSSL